jgi:hypothetical protein
MSVTVECPIKKVRIFKILLENIVSITGHRKSESLFPTFQYTTTFRPELPLVLANCLSGVHVP